MLKTIWEYVKKNYNWLFDCLLIVVLIAAIWHMITCHSSGTYDGAEHKQAVEETVLHTKEVKTNAETLHREQAANDRRIQQRVKQAVDGVPSELTALVDMANAVIRDSYRHKLRYSADDGAGPADAAD